MQPPRSIPNRGPEFTDDFLRKAHIHLRDDSLRSVLDAAASRPLDFLANEEKRKERLYNTAFEWAMNPFQKSANIVKGRYLKYFQDRPANEELEFLMTLARSVEELDGMAWNSLMIPLCFSQHLHVRASAALHMAGVYPSGKKMPPLAGPDYLLDLAAGTIKIAPKEVRLASFIGIWHLGDLRFTSKLVDAYRTFDVADRRTVAKTFPGFFALGTVEFLIEALKTEQDEGVYGSLAGMLAHFGNKVTQAGEPLFNLERAFPSYAKPGPFKKREKVTLQSFQEKHERSFQDLYENENGESVIPMTMEAWGLTCMPRGLNHYSLTPEDRLGNLSRGTLGKIIPEPVGGPHSILSSSRELMVSYQHLEPSELWRILPFFSVIREIKSLPEGLNLPLSYLEALTFFSGYTWHESKVDWEKLIQPIGDLKTFVQLTQGFSELLKSFKNQFKDNVPFCLTDLDAAFLGFKKSINPGPEPEGLIERKLHLLTAFCMGCWMKSNAVDIKLSKLLPHQKLVIESAKWSVDFCPRSHELSNLPRQAIANSLLKGEEIDAVLRGQYFIDALRSDIADAHEPIEWVNDAVDIASRAYPTAEKKRRVRESLGEKGCRDIDALFTVLEELAGDSLGDWWALYRSSYESDLANTPKELTSFDEIALAVDFGIWIPFANND